MILEQIDATLKSISDLKSSQLPNQQMQRNVGSHSADQYINHMAVNFKRIVTSCNTSPVDTVLDIGSGCGKLAQAFAFYLNSEATYHGFDVWEEGINWTKKNIEMRCDSKFSILTASNDYYNDSDTDVSNDFDFEFLGDEKFDTIFAISVLTHLKLKDAEQYIALVRNFLSQNGRAYLTCFVIDDSFNEYRSRTGDFSDVSQADTGLYHAYTGSQFFAGFPTGMFESLVNDAGLNVIEYKPGSWCGRKEAHQYQDVFVVSQTS